MPLSRKERREQEEARKARLNQAKTENQTHAHQPTGVYQKEYHQEPPRKKRGGCWTCGCAAAILLIVLVVGAIGFKAFIDVQFGRGYRGVELDQEEQEVLTLEDSEIATALLMGIDTGTEGRRDQGRSDTMIVASANPHNDTMNLASIPRDTYVNIPGYGMDKINHAYAFGGPELAVETVSQFFNIPIDYYFAVDMQGLVDVINAIGGITLTPTMTFELGGYSFQEGVLQNLSGEQALAYSRQRYDDSTGDYGRQARQRQVIMATIENVATIENISSMPAAMLALNESVDTNASVPEMLAGFQKYGSTLSNVNQYQMSGRGEMIDGVYYEIVPDSEQENVRAFLFTV